MAQNVIELMFGVAGEGSISTGSGALIAQQLGVMITNLERGGKTKIKLDFDLSEAGQKLKDELQAMTSSLNMGDLSSSFKLINDSLKVLSDTISKLNMSSMDGILTKLGELRDLVSSLNSKSFNMTQVINYKGVSTATQDLELYRNKAKETVLYVQQLARVTSDFAGAHESEFQYILDRSGINLSNYVAAIDKYTSSEQKLRSKNGSYLDVISSATQIKELSGLTSAMREFLDMLEQIVYASNGRIPWPDSSGLEKAMADIEAANEKMKDFDETMKNMAMGGKNQPAAITEESLSRMTEPLSEIKATVQAIGEAISKMDLSGVENELKTITGELNKINEVMKQITETGLDITDNTPKETKEEKKATKTYRDKIRAMREYYAQLQKVQKLATRDSGLTGDEESGYSYSGKNEWIQKEIKLLNDKKNAMDEVKVSTEEGTEAYKEKVKMSEKAEAAELKSLFMAQTSWDKATAKAQDYITRVEYAASRDVEAVKKMDAIRKLANEGAPKNIDELNAKLADLQQYIHKNGLDVETWGQKFKKAFGARARSLLSGLVLGKLTQYLREIYTNVVQIDGALTQLKIVTGATDSQMEKFLKNSISLSKELGANLTDVLKSMETFSRLGYSLEESSTLSEYATILSKVASVDSEEATKGLTSIIKGYGFDVNNSQHVADVLIEVGQKYAVSASELMEAYQKAGAALNATNTSFEKSAGLIAAGNAAMQDASAVGTALKTISARIRGSKTDLDDLGESTDDLAEGFSKYAEEIQSLTGFNIMVEGTTDTYKDLYDIFEGISQRWEDLSDTQQARIAEILGGTRQYSVIASILSNWGDAAGAYADAMNSAGVSTKANAIYLDSIEGRIGQLTASFQEFSTEVLNSDVIKNFISLLSGILPILQTILTMGDGITIKFTAFVVVIEKLQSVWEKINKAKAAEAGIYAFLKLLKDGSLMQAITKINSTGFTGILTSIPKLIAGLINARVEMVKTGGAAKSLKVIMDEMKISATSLYLAIAALVATIAVAVIKNINEAAQKASDAALESYEKAKEAVDKLKEESDTFDELIDRYKELQNLEKNSAEYISEAADIQQKIRELLGGQAKDVDTVNGKYEQQLQLLYAIKANQYSEEDLAKYSDAYSKAIDSYKSAYVSDREDAPDLLEWTYNKDIVLSTPLWTDKPTSIEDYFRQKGSDEAKFIYDVLKGLNGNAVSDLYQTSSSGGFETSFNIIGSNAAEKIASIKKIQEAFNEEGIYSSKLLSKLIKIKEEYQVFVDNLDSSENDFIGALVSNANILKLSQGFYVTSENIKEYEDALFNAVKATNEFKEITGYTDDELRDYIEAFLQLNYSEQYGEYAQSAGLLSLDLLTLEAALDKLEDPFNVLTAAMKDMEEYGSLTASTLRDIVDNNLTKYLTETNGLYELNTEALKEMVNEFINYQLAQAALSEQNSETAAKNIQTYMRVFSSLMTGTKENESITDQLEKQKDAYKELIDIRKELLDQYKSQIEYEKELADKQKEVVDLQTKLNAASLDNTAAGRARYRDLQSQLESAQDELDSFTLEHAIEEVTNELDKQYEEYERFIDAKLNSIETAINSNTSAFQDCLNALIVAYQSVPVIRSGEPDDGILAVVKPGKMSKVSEKDIRLYHSGGAVGDLESNEEFAKLMKGEFVVTPQMMNNFMNNTIPQVASGNEFNAPLIEIKCDNVTRESLPGLKSIVDEAVEEVKKQLNSGFSRTGYKKTVSTIK